MSTIAFDQFALTRIADFARSLSRLHRAARRQVIDDDQIDREFNAVCQSIWGYTTDDFNDELFSLADHAWLDSLDEAHARLFAAEQGYDLVDDHGMLTRLVGLLLDDPRREARTADAGKPRGGACGDRGEIPDDSERHRRGDDAVTSAQLGALAARGERASQSHSPAPRCCPAAATARPCRQLTGATFISPSRARTSAFKPG